MREAEGSLRERLLQAARTGGIESVRQTLRAFRAEPGNRYRNVAALMLEAAVALHSTKHAEEALWVAQSAARDFPENADAPLVLALLAEQAKRTADYSSIGNNNDVFPLRVSGKY